MIWIADPSAVECGDHALGLDRAELFIHPHLNKMHASAVHRYTTICSRQNLAETMSSRIALSFCSSRPECIDRYCQLVTTNDFK